LDQSHAQRSEHGEDPPVVPTARLVQAAATRERARRPAGEIKSLLTLHFPDSHFWFSDPCCSGSTCNALTVIAVEQAGDGMVLIQRNANGLELQAPFHPNLSLHAKALGGRWRGQEVGWVFSIDRAEALRALCLRVWGVDGTPEAFADLVQLRVEVDEQDIRYPIWEGYNNAVYLVGREIAASLKNRRAARPGRGVKFLSGKPNCRTYLNAYWTTVPNGSVFLLKETPRMAVDRVRSALDGHGRMEVLAA
jgi:hypothetical protein